MHPERLEGEIEDQFRAILKHAGAPERGADGEAPLGRAEPGLGLADLEDPDGRVEAAERDRKAHIAPGGALTERPGNESLEPFDGRRRRRNETRHFFSSEERE